MEHIEIRRSRITRAKRAFTTRRVPAKNMKTLVVGDISPISGNVVLASVYELGKHRKIEKPCGRRALMLPGDEIIVCYGNRYAPDQFEALVCDDLSLCDLVAGGGIASREVNRHDRMLPPTQIMPIGLIGDEKGNPLNIADFCIDFKKLNRPIKRIKVIVVVGTAMNSGKTFTAASIVRGLKNSGFRVAGIKATGTGSGGDLWQMKDMGADTVLDFTDAGFASTYKASDESIEIGMLGLIAHAEKRRCDFAIVEIADGLQHIETATLLRSKALQGLASGCVFAASDSMGARAGYQELYELGYSVLAISGQLTRSPLAMREAKTCGCPIYTPFDIQLGALMPALTGAIDADAIKLLKSTVNTEIKTTDEIVLDYDSHSRQCVRQETIEKAHALDFPDEFDEIA